MATHLFVTASFSCCTIIIYNTFLINFVLIIMMKEIYLCIYWLAMSNSMYNPMIYCYMNQRWYWIWWWWWFWQMTPTQITWDRICICVLIVRLTISHFAFWNALCWSSEWWLACLWRRCLENQIVCGRSEWKLCAAGLERASERRWTELCAGQLIMDINSFALFNTIFMKMCDIRILHRNILKF